MMAENGLIEIAMGATIVVGGEEARHAIRVKRVRAGERIEVMDGRGVIAAGVVAEIDEGGKKRDGMVTVRVEEVRRLERERPRVEVWTAVAKGGRVDEMVDQLAQVGAAEWRGLETARSVAGAREQKVERLERIAREASKQCGRAWTMEIGAARTMAEAVKGEDGVRVVVCDASGERWPSHSREAGRVAPSDDATIRLLIGPEGGWTEQEMEMCRAAGAVVARFGAHVMRIETAGVVACGVVMAGV
jgi:16S rRNA (uracil1498-N3)-methyltransferase